jgi:hypothetical protein
MRDARSDWDRLGDDRLFRWLLVGGGLVWIIDGIPDVVSGPWGWGLVQIAIGVGFVGGHRRIAASVERRRTARSERRDLG